LAQIEREHALLTVGKLLKELVRVPLDSVGRASEDKFLVLLTEINHENSLKVKERIENALALHDINAAVKYACYPDDSTNLEELIGTVQ